MTESDVNRAVVFAAKAHQDQRRKYSGEPYVSHVIEVMMLVREHGGSEAMQCVALLHDVIEDCGVIYLEVKEAFGKEVADMVSALTDQEQGNRATRKAASCARLAAASAEVQTIKCADLISNTASIVARDPDFAKVYLKEKAALLKAVTKAEYTIRNRAIALIPSEIWNG